MAPRRAKPIQGQGKKNSVTQGQDSISKMSKKKQSPKKRRATAKAKAPIKIQQEIPGRSRSAKKIPALLVSTQSSSQSHEEGTSVSEIESQRGAKKTKENSTPLDPRSNDGMIDKSKIQDFLELMGKTPSEKKLAKYHRTVNAFIKEFLDKLCAKNSFGVFSYLQLEKALQARGLLTKKTNELALQFCTVYTQGQLKKMEGILIPPIHRLGRGEQREHDTTFIGNLLDPEHPD